MPRIKDGANGKWETMSLSDSLTIVPGQKRKRKKRVYIVAMAVGRKRLDSYMTARLSLLLAGGGGGGSSSSTIKPGSNTYP
jgi:hypothetical protein